MDRRVVHPGFVEDLLSCLGGTADERAALLQAAGLDGAGDGPVDVRRFARLWLDVARAMDDEFLGLGARPMRPGGFALLCQAALHTSTLEHALRRSLRFLNLVLDQPRGRLDTEGGLAVISLTHSGKAGRALGYRTYWVILLGVACWLVGRSLPLRDLDFDCAAPVNRAEYGQFFGAPVRFGQPLTRLRFDARHLRLPVARSDAALRTFLRAAPANILARYRHDQGTVAQVRSRLAAGPASEWPGFEALAAQMQMSPATLRRRLREEGRSFSAIRAEAQLVQARRLLLESGLSVAEIAAELAYSEPSAFHRAFLKQTGVTPGAYRRWKGGVSGDGDPS